MPEQPWENEFESFDRWNPDTAEVLDDLLRALRRKKGFGLFFVQCNPAQGTRVINAIQKRFPQKRLVEFELNRQSETLYGELLERYQGEKFEIACVTGVEQALYAYEDTKRLAGWSSEEIYNYSWKGLPPLLGHLNRQREAFEANLPIALIFLVPSFAIDYFVQRAPDFFDWRSGFFKFVESKEDIRKACQELVGKEYEEYLSLTSEERIEKILEIKDKIILLDASDYERKSDLLREQGLLFESDGDSSRALDCYDRAIEIKPNYYYAWHSRGNILINLERYEEAIENYDRALEIEPNHLKTWKNRGSALINLERYEEALESYDRALEIEPGAYLFWMFRGDVLSLGRYEEAIESYDRVLEIKSNYHYAWRRKGFLFYQLGKFKEALICFAKVTKIQPSEDRVWNNQGYLALVQYSYGLQPIYEKPLLIRQTQDCSDGQNILEIDLDLCEKSLQLFDTALNLDSKLTLAWANRSFPAYYLQQYQSALQNCDKALKIDPENEEERNEVIYTNRGCILLKLHNPTAALKDFTKALEIDPKLDEAWIGHGTALYQLERYPEAIDSFTQALNLNHPLAQTNLMLTRQHLES
ncbi:tetratricopeptide repeat protein [Oscillatoriales cyanobacterium LEGE 11467]|uniref:Tetratricopeptide repeat protein n=1 Tax=Zarconia navalis LEGE 11467 TaxID=1828826 RepID=A0A928Z9X2_9CYAN|nr:tetratricopeptide repeat protein [Zarconia navalis]MBE9042128.1 tetratricopeptide repeat protein [Zarconia navalis LEGE 11467]